MSFWRLSPAEETGSIEAMAHNAIAWDQLLNNLDLQTSSSSSSSDSGEVLDPRSHASTLSEGRLSFQDGRVLKLRSSSSAGSHGCAKQHKLSDGPREDDGYSSEDEHDSPGNPDSSDSVLAAFRASPGLTATTKVGSTDGIPSGPASPNVPPKSYFFVNGVRHCVQEEQGVPEWSAKVMQTPPAAAAIAPKTPPKMAAESAMPPPPPWTAPSSTHVRGAVPLSAMAVAKTAAGVPAAWVCTPKNAGYAQAPPPSPPKYDAPRGVPSGYAMPPSVAAQQFPGAFMAPPGMQPNPAYYPADSNRNITMMPMKPAAGVVPPYTSVCASAPQMNAPPFYAGNPNAVNNAAPPASAILGYVYMDRDGQLRVASQGGSPQPPPPPPPAAPAVPPPQLPRMPSEAAAMYQGASLVPGMNPMQYNATYAADGNMVQPLVPPMPLSNLTPAAWGSTKAWVFRDGRWISLSM